MLLAFAGVVIGLDACQSPLEGDLHQVRFQARSGGNRTKTEYGGIETEGSDKYKVINWISGDKIRIYAPVTNPETVTSSGTSALTGYVNADYQLIDIATTGHTSTAKLSPADAHGLMWADGSGTTNFYAVYPKDYEVSTSGGAIAATVAIPAAQDGGADVSGLPLVAAASNVASGGAVELDFKPAFTTFQFTLKSSAGSGSLTLNRVTLSTAESNTIYVAGKCFCPIAGGSATYDASDKSKAVSVSFNPKPVISELDAFATTFTLFALPVNLTDMTLTVNWTKDHVTMEKSLKLNKDGSPLSFGAGHFIQITGVAVPDQGIRFFLNDVTVDPLVGESHTIVF